MSEFEETHLWQSTLAYRENDKYDSQRERLRVAYMALRDKVGMLVGEIARDLPDYTVHDLTHLDALWSMADIVCGPDYKLTPTEAFVLGGAILLHDAAMSLAAYPSGISELKDSAEWSDTVVYFFQRTEGRRPSDVEIQEPPAEVLKEVIADLLRQMHAKHSAKLLACEWRVRGDSMAHRLMGDDELRGIFGQAIGMIAHSHWWSVDEVERRLDRRVNAPVIFPQLWSFDLLKVAAILRAADASHVDARRAPAFLRALRKPSGVSGNHWNFQSKLARPALQNDQIVYTSVTSFGVEDADAWWLCLDTLKMIDSELRRSDQLIAAKRGHNERFAARSVANIGSLEKLTNDLPVVDWIPVSAEVHISGVTEIVKKLGGSALYGDKPDIALRELIQNASDAIRARRVVDGVDDEWGEVVVRILKSDDGHVLEVEDNGLGMGQDVLVHHLLNFGQSFWGSELMRREFPGLLTRGVGNAGKFGIGFFSVFMISKKVRVTTRRCGAAKDQTFVLDFRNGVDSRPILRVAGNDEALQSEGTKVSAVLEPDTDHLERLLRSSYDETGTIVDVCGELCPSLDVSVSVEDRLTDVIHRYRANDWLELEPIDFISRLQFKPMSSNEFLDAFTEENAQTVRRLSENLRTVRDEHGVAIARAFLCPPVYGERAGLPGVVSVGGLKSGDLRGICGVLTGETNRAARDTAIPHLRGEPLVSWANEQVNLCEESSLTDKDQQEIAMTVLRLGGDVGALKIAEAENTWFDKAAVLAKFRMSDEIVLNSGYHALEKEEEFRMDNRVVRAPMFSYSSILMRGPADDSERDWLPIAEGDFFANSIGFFLLALLDEAWGTSYYTMAMGDERRRLHMDTKIGRWRGEDIFSNQMVLKR
ncbi:ATP-binding protein [Parvibaculaceae bacterium PLY_AMNH_Bact1]|nr:ATP-binding protein [Parvibaculaceae bacterium PLY_AMNH_Bact1]